MAYYDSNGKITIDENAAQRDIRKLNEAIEYLTNMEHKVNAVQNLATNFSGEYATAQAEQAYILSKEINRNISALKNSISDIKYTVNKYKILDQKLKESIMSSGGGIGAFGSGKNGGFR